MYLIVDEIPKIRKFNLIKYFYQLDFLTPGNKH